MVSEDAEERKGFRSGVVLPVTEETRVVLVFPVASDAATSGCSIGLLLSSSMVQIESINLIVINAGVAFVARKRRTRVVFMFPAKSTRSRVRRPSVHFSRQHRLYVTKAKLSDHSDDCSNLSPSPGAAV